MHLLQPRLWVELHGDKDIRRTLVPTQPILDVLELLANSLSVVTDPIWPRLFMTITSHATDVEQAADVPSSTHAVTLLRVVDRIPDHLPLCDVPAA